RLECRTLFAEVSVGRRSPSLLPLVPVAAKLEFCYVSWSKLSLASPPWQVRQGRVRCCSRCRLPSGSESPPRQDIAEYAGSSYPHSDLSGRDQTPANRNLHR